MSEATTTVHAEPEHSPFLQHHFQGMGQQFDASKIGMWLFLVTEVLLFGGLFVGYAIMHAKCCWSRVSLWLWPSGRLRHRNANS
jgi:heme/copper-type cytochrome/quinol oxidase subunit 3